MPIIVCKFYSRVCRCGRSRLVPFDSKVKVCFPNWFTVSCVKISPTCCVSCFTPNKKIPFTICMESSHWFLNTYNFWAIVSTLNRLFFVRYHYGWTFFHYLKSFANNTYFMFSGCELAPCGRGRFGAHVGFRFADWAGAPRSTSLLICKAARLFTRGGVVLRCT